MPASVSRPLGQLQRYGRLWWLPPNGQGNGLDDVAWAPIADVRAAVVGPLLAAFGTAEVPAYAAPARRSGTGRTWISQGKFRPRGSLGRTHAGTAEASYHIWVGSSAHGRAEEILRTELPALLHASHAQR